ncbi:MAG: KOW domain-containing RNA-binding protein [Clostridiales bacterium]|nr:KOW domain-containing RNA-binding protein [Clostridiales bacterium]
MEKVTVIEAGSVVFSRAGRDGGRYYVVVKAGEKPGFVFIADGEYRKLEKPKLKKIKHLRISGVVLEKLKNKFAEDKTVFDAEIRSALRPYNEKKAEEAKENDGISKDGD